MAYHMVSNLPDLAAALYFIYFIWDQTDIELFTAFADALYEAAHATVLSTVRFTDPLTRRTRGLLDPQYNETQMSVKRKADKVHPISQEVGPSIQVTISRKIAQVNYEFTFRLNHSAIGQKVQRSYNEFLLLEDNLK